MHQAGGSGGRKNSWRCAGSRQRGAAAFAAATSSGVSAKMLHTRAVLSADTVTIRLPSRGFRIPQPRGLVERRGHDALAVGAERCAAYIFVVFHEPLADRLAGLRIPQPRRVVAGRRDDAFAVGAERRAANLAN